MARRRMRSARRGFRRPKRREPSRSRIVSAIANAEIAVALALLALCHGGALIGLEAMSVRSGSMEPAVPVGAMAYVRPLADGEAVREGDVIAFTTSDREGAATVLHRVVSVDADRGALSTKGDANDAVDPFEVPLDAVVGTLEASIPCLGGAIERFAEHKAVALGAIVTANFALLAVASTAPRRSRSTTNDWRRPCTKHRENRSAGFRRARGRRWRLPSGASPSLRESEARLPTSRTSIAR